MSASAASPAQPDSLVRWPIPTELTSSPAVAYRNRFASELARRTPEEIISRYVYLTVPQMERMVRLAQKHLNIPAFRGVGLEPGAGCGALSSVVARSAGVEKIFALEICEGMAGEVIPKVAKHVLGAHARKVVPVLGSFDDLRLADNSVDFVVEIDSLHHSDDLVTTLRECRRVLKPGGFLLAFDRCHPNTVTDAEVEAMLSQVYSKQFLAANHYPLDAVLTRRENGEHEFRLFEWQNAFRAAGFQFSGIATFVAEIPLRHAVKGCLRILPTPLRKSIYKTDNADFGTTLKWVAQPFTVARHRGFGRTVLAPKSTTVFLVQKP